MILTTTPALIEQGRAQCSASPWSVTVAVIASVGESTVMRVVEDIGGGRSRLGKGHGDQPEFWYRWKGEFASQWLGRFFDHILSLGDVSPNAGGLRDWLVDLRGFEPLTPWLQTMCSPS
jgi:hypothetical protein